MANIDAPMGLAPYQGTKRINHYTAGGTTDIYQGDVVSLKSNGKVVTTQTTTGSDNILGVAVHYLDVSADTDLAVYDHPDQRFTVQSDGATAPAQTNVGNTAPLVLTTGNTTTKISKHELDVSAMATGTADPLRIEGFMTGPGRTIAANADIVVSLQKHIFSSQRKSV